ncbi:hypothetical protein LTR86_009775 [Recurvomyces mirabilis]|nr:hypothetical protein LTR86_009775 [Recurvomyces mirabilis]
MLNPPRVDNRRIVFGLLVALSIFGIIKWARTTTPEHAEQLKILPLLAIDPGYSFFPPSKQRCSIDPARGHDSDSPLCDGILINNKTQPRVHVVLKTGASERDKTELLLQTLLACTPAVTIVSDMQDEIQGHHVIDILAELPASYAIVNPEWKSYEAQKGAAEKGEPIYKSPDGWLLDRFKFLPMIEKVYELDPHADWYFFTEADVYFVWDTLYRLISQMNASESQYIGVAAPGANHTFFAYGGGGFLLSGALMHRLLHNKTESISIKYEKMARDGCCGDATLAYVIRQETGVVIQNAYPTISGEALYGLGVGKENWCLPLLSLHRVSPDLMQQLWRWERCRPYDELPIRISTVLDFALSPILRNGSTLRSWDNFSNQARHRFHPAHSSASNCAHYCFVDHTCLQWTYFKDQCRTADVVKQGQYIDDNDVVSGWNTPALERLGYRIHGDSSATCGT